MATHSLARCGNVRCAFSGSELEISDNDDFGEEHGDRLGFLILGLTPDVMGKGNWSVGVITDARATANQRDAMTAIASAAAGGPMAAGRTTVSTRRFPGTALRTVSLGDCLRKAVRGHSHDFVALDAGDVGQAVLELANCLVDVPAGSTRKTLTGEFVHQKMTAPVAS
jgi:hypothetical protein